MYVTSWFLLFMRGSKLYSHSLLDYFYFFLLGVWCSPESLVSNLIKSHPQCKQVLINLNMKIFKSPFWEHQSSIYFPSPCANSPRSKVSFDLKLISLFCVSLRIDGSHGNHSIYSLIGLKRLEENKFWNLPSTAVYLILFFSLDISCQSVLLITIFPRILDIVLISINFLDNVLI